MQPASLEETQPEAEPSSDLGTVPEEAAPALGPSKPQQRTRRAFTVGCALAFILGQEVLAADLPQSFLSQIPTGDPKPISHRGATDSQINLLQGIGVVWIGQQPVEDLYC